MTASKKPQTKSSTQPPAMLDLIRLAYRQSGSFVPRVVELDDVARKTFVAFRRNPGKFVDTMFDGDWSVPGQNPQRGEIRLVAVVESRHGLWIVGRQGHGIFANLG